MEMIMIDDEHHKLGDLGIASPISSRLLAIGNNNFEEMRGGSSGNRWPRQETLSLLQIRSEMDAVFRDATLKGPLWEQVSGKLGEFGYQRNAKKCKEKLENVQKYYMRTKESRGGRHDGKSYKFFNQLEALNTTPDNNHPSILPAPPPPQSLEASAPAPTPPPLFNTVRASFSSPSSSSSSDAEQVANDEIETELGDDNINPIRRRKRKRSSGDDSTDERMMEFFEGLLKQVIQKQEIMQQKFLQAVEKREKDIMIREETWIKQDMARLAKQHDLMSHDRPISASRDAAIISFLQKITGQKIHLPHTPPPPPPPPPPPLTTTTFMQHHHRQQSLTTPKIIETHHHRRNFSTSTSRELVVASVMLENQQIQQPHEFDTGMEITVAATSSSSPSRWPKAEVLALIQLRSGMEHRYQETGVPKGPLWEEISAGMKRMGYNRNPKRCKEKWENINKYFKKVKESDKKRPEDTKTCPYFHELDELYRKKVLGNTSISIVISSLPEQERQQVRDVGIMSSVQSLHGNKSEDKDGGKNELQAVGTVGASPSNLSDEQTQSNIGGSKQPEAMLKKQHDQQGRGIIMMENCSKKFINGLYGDDLDRDENDDDDSYEDVDENEEYDAKTEEEMKMVYKIQFQRQNNVRSSDGTGGTSSSTSFMAMVQ